MMKPKPPRVPATPRHARVTEQTEEGLFLDLPADDLIHPTHWPTIDILPAQLNLYWAELQAALDAEPPQGLEAEHRFLSDFVARQIMAPVG